MVVPSSGYETIFDAEGLRRYRRLLSRASKTETLNWPEPSGDAFLAAGRLVADRSDVLIAVWDGRRHKEKVGLLTSSAMRNSTGSELSSIWPRESLVSDLVGNSRNLRDLVVTRLSSTTDDDRWC